MSIQPAILSFEKANTAVTILASGLIVFEFFAFIMGIFPSISAQQPLPFAVSGELLMGLSSLALLFLRKPEETRLNRFFAQIISSAVFIAGIFIILPYIDNATYRLAPLPLLVASNFILIGAALLLLDSTLLPKWSFQALTLIVLLDSFFSLSGYIYEIDTIYTIAAHTRMDISTSFGFFTLCLAILLSRPKVGVIQILFEDSLSGFLIRRIPILVFFTSALFSLLANKGQHLGWFDDSFSDLLTTISTIVILFVVLWNSASLLSREEKKRAQAEMALNETEHKVKEMTEKDPLTGLLNFSMLEKKLNEKIQNKSFSSGIVLIFDIHKFKLINEAMGYDAGNLLLKAIAKRLTLQSFFQKCLLSRFSSDKFVLTLENIESTHQVVEYIYQIFAVFKESFYIKEKELQLTISVGVSFSPADGKNAKELLQHADIALEDARQDEGNIFRFFSKELIDIPSTRLNLENELRHAVTKNQFVLYFQPKVDLKTGMISSVEALIRWHHPEKGLLQPGAFMPTVEDSGLIVPITEWIIREICNLFSKDAIHIPVAINISANHLHEEHNLANYLQQMVKGFHINTHNIELEITETALMSQTQHVITMLATLKSMGFTLTLDDFGTKFSSLSYLHNIAVDKIKIDKSFIDNMLSTTDDAHILKAIIALLHTLGKKVIAEGVENAAQLEFLIQEGCDEVQGYYFSKPLTLDELNSLLQSEKKWDMPLKSLA